MLLTCVGAQSSRPPRGGGHGAAESAAVERRVSTAFGAASGNVIGPGEFRIEKGKVSRAAGPQSAQRLPVDDARGVGAEQRNQVPQRNQPGMDRLAERHTEGCLH